MLRPTTILALSALGAAFEDNYPYTHTNCGVTHTFTKAPDKVVTMNQGAAEFMLAMGLQDSIAGQRAVTNLVDPIWPRYAEANAKINVVTTNSGYPTDAEIMAVDADFIFASFRSAFREKDGREFYNVKGIFTNDTVGPCDGENSDFFPTGSNETREYSTCRPQLNANGIGTWLEPLNCEDESLRKPATPETLYEAITQLGRIFNVRTVASQLISEIKNDFLVAEKTLASAPGKALTAIWLDCITCCSKEAVPSVMVGAGAGGPHLVMEQSGLTNLFPDLPGSFKCVPIADVIALDPDVMVLVEAGFNPSLDKIRFLYNHSDFCKQRYVQRADYIKVPFSASSLGPRNGAAALDIVTAALHVTTGGGSGSAMNFQSGVDTFDPEILAAHTAGLRCPVDLDKVKYAKTSYTSCGITHTLTRIPERVVTLNQGVTEFMLAMGLEDKMAGTAYLDDEIWPRYAAAYAKIPVLAQTYPNETTLMSVSPDFVIGSYMSAFSEQCDGESCYKSAIFTDATVGPCEGVNSDFFPAGSNTTTKYSTCRPQLHAAGIGTYLNPVYCEDMDLRGDVTEETVYTAITDLGTIFNVPYVAESLISDIRNDFSIAEKTLQSSGHSLKAIWFDCLGCCKDPEHIMIGVGFGAHNLVMKSAGLTNMYADHTTDPSEGGYVCLNGSDVLAKAKDADVMVLIDAAWSSKLGKVDWLHNHSELCKAPVVQHANYITVPFSASTLGPRNGAAALDMVSAVIQVSTGDSTMNFQSGVGIFEPPELAARTASLRCPVDVTTVKYSVSYKGDPAPLDDKSDDLPTWAIAVIVVICLLLVAVLAFASAMYYREKQGKPMFLTLEEPLAQNKVTQPAVQLSQRTATQETKPVDSV